MRTFKTLVNTTDVMINTNESTNEILVDLQSIEKYKSAQVLPKGAIKNLEFFGGRLKRLDIKRCALKFLEDSLEEAGVSIEDVTFLPAEHARFANTFGKPVYVFKVAGGLEFESNFILTKDLP